MSLCCVHGLFYFFKTMKYHIQKPIYTKSSYGEIYICDHPVYSRCTLFKIKDRGFAVIQQRYDDATKHTWWGEIDEWLTTALYSHPQFKSYFDFRADVPKDGLYPTTTIRQIMWAFRMKPLPKQRWETVFDHKEI